MGPVCSAPSVPEPPVPASCLLPRLLPRLLPLAPAPAPAPALARLHSPLPPLPAGPPGALPAGGRDLAPARAAGVGGSDSSAPCLAPGPSPAGVSAALRPRPCPREWPLRHAPCPPGGSETYGRCGLDTLLTMKLVTCEKGPLADSGPGCRTARRSPGKPSLGTDVRGAAPPSALRAFTSAACVTVCVPGPHACARPHVRCRQ